MEWLDHGRLSIGTKDSITVWSIVHGGGRKDEWPTIGAMRSCQSVMNSSLSKNSSRGSIEVIETKSPMQNYAFEQAGKEALLAMRDGTIAISPVSSPASVGAHNDWEVQV